MIHSLGVGCTALALLLGHGPQSPGHAVAVTFDDLPVVSTHPLHAALREALTRDLLQAVLRHRVPAIGFVNENKLADSTGDPDPARVDLLRRWLDAGLELGNHTWSHPDLHLTPLSTFEAEVLQGEVTTRRLLAERGQAPRYFRHPFLHTGRSVAVRDSLTAFLRDHGYQVAPVTIDNSDYVFAEAYDRALAAPDVDAAARVRSAYLAYMDSVIGFYERQAQAILGRDIPQVLLLHASRLNAASFDSLAGVFERRRYRFVSLGAALADSAYRLPDTYAGPGGITWLHRWALTRGTPHSVFEGEPEVPDWVVLAARREP
jgi:peptidoglycan/xylan/chitin deacetylase (PgdA/CDA1 family)